MHLQFCKKVLGVKRSTQNDFVYGELGRINYQSRRFIAKIKYWLKVISSDETKYTSFTCSGSCPVPGHVILTCKLHISGKL